MMEIERVILANQLAIMRVLLFMAPDAETDLEKKAIAELIASIAETEMAVEDHVLTAAAEAGEQSKCPHCGKQL